MTSLKLLFIEDDPKAVADLIQLLVEKGGYKYRVCKFAAAKAEIEATAPDIIVLDLAGGTAGPGEEAPGLSVMEDIIWKHRFCPVVVYTSYPRLFVERADHPFIEVVTKGRMGPKNALAAIGEFEPQAHAIREAEGNIRAQIGLALREVAPTAFNVFRDPSDSEIRKDIINRAGRRRVAALMDERSGLGEALAPWEQYLSPPISKNIRLGDILQRKGAPHDDPDSYCIVLTPTCDLETDEKRNSKVESVLVAYCCSYKEGFKSKNWGNIKKASLKKRLTDIVLPQGYFENIVPIPALHNQIPHMLADMRNLELVPLKDIGGEGETGFKVIASIDSPFREMVAWAYMRTACRPGLPDRDYVKWCEEILKDLSEEGPDNGSA